mmetsp:Transcript_4326/g.6866  ORF Transcript_4326/g.6866 Transcript_4326/m.6866 type:complete len:145 (+) Transcript_4326:556-990(+)
MRRVQQVAFISENIYYFFLTVGLYIQMMLANCIPFIGPGICFMHVCWLYALYSFDYRWDKQGGQLLSRLHYFEERWAYFLGFGFPLAVVTTWSPSLVAYGLYALTAPVFIMLAITANPVQHVSEDRAVESSAISRLPIYTMPKM